MLPAIAAGALSLAGGAMANRANRREAQRNRNFQERMRNTQWQSAVADMEAAGINPALAYSQGPNAAPGGSTASQMDALSPAISSAMQMKRMRADLELIKQQERKASADADAAQTAATLAAAQLSAYGIERTPSGSLKFTTNANEMPWIARDIHSRIQGQEQNARRMGATADTLQPLADLSNRMGELLPILGLMSTIAPGGVIGRARNFMKRPKPLPKSRRIGPGGR